MWLSPGPRATDNKIYTGVQNMGTSRGEGCAHHCQPLQCFAQSPLGEWPPVCSGRGAACYINVDKTLKSLAKSPGTGRHEQSWREAGQRDLPVPDLKALPGTVNCICVRNFMLSFPGWGC